MGTPEKTRLNKWIVGTVNGKELTALTSRWAPDVDPTDSEKCSVIGNVDLFTDIAGNDRRVKRRMYRNVGSKRIAGTLGITSYVGTNFINP